MKMEEIKFRLKAFFTFANYRQKKDSLNIRIQWIKSKNVYKKKTKYGTGHFIVYFVGDSVIKHDRYAVTTVNDKGLIVSDPIIKKEVQKYFDCKLLGEKI